MNNDTLIEVVIVTFNSERHIGPCLDSIQDNGGNAVVVDNGSIDSTEAIVRSHADTRFISAGTNQGYGKSINLGFRQTHGDFVVLSNPDIVYGAGSIGLMVNYLKQNPNVGIVGAQQTFPDGTWQRSYGDLPGVWSGFKDASGINSFKHWIRKVLWPKKLDRVAMEVPYVDGGVLVVRRSAFQQVDGFDETFYFYGDESDLCLRMRKAGWKVVFFPEAQVIHARGGDSLKVDRSDKFLRYLVTSRMLLAQRCIAGWQARLYARLEQIYFLELSLFYRLIRSLRRDREDRQISERVWMFDSYVKIWQEYLSTGTVSKSYR